MNERSLSLHPPVPANAAEYTRSIGIRAIIAVSPNRAICRTPLPNCRSLEVSPCLADYALTQPVLSGDVSDCQRFLVSLELKLPQDLQRQPPIPQPLVPIRKW